jgi:hypothetical protein
MTTKKLLFAVACVGTYAASAQDIPSVNNRPEHGTPVRLRLQRTISSADTHVNHGVPQGVADVPSTQPIRY